MIYFGICTWVSENILVTSHFTNAMYEVLPCTSTRTSYDTSRVSVCSSSSTAPLTAVLCTAALRTAIVSAAALLATCRRSFTVAYHTAVVSVRSKGRTTAAVDAKYGVGMERTYYIPQLQSIWNAGMSEFQVHFVPRFMRFTSTCLWSRQSQLSATYSYR